MEKLTCICGMGHVTPRALLVKDKLDEKGDEVMYMLLPDNKSDHMQQGHWTLYHIIK